MDLKTVVKHLANGSLGDELCVVCLQPLTGDNWENVLTSICKKDEEYCIADVLREVCQIKILDTDHFNICCDCFQSASAAYKFYLQAKQSHEIIYFYTDQLLKIIEGLEITEEDSKRLLCIPLPVFSPEISGFDYGFDSIGSRKMGDGETTDAIVDKIDNDEVVMIIKDDETLLYSVQDGALQEIELEQESDDENVLMIVNEKTRKKRDPMMFISCLHCPVKYRFVSKLKEHEKKMHNADIYYCKICKLITDKKDDYEEHLPMHIGNYQCTKCNAVYRKESSLNDHLKCHDDTCEAEKLENGNICEICGVILENEVALEEHRTLRHVKRFTCYYCGRMYKGQSSFEMHIQKHEKHLKSSNQLTKKQEPKLKPPELENSLSSSKRCICGVCGKSFVDERSLLWHQRLHNNDRPFVCNVCGRGFVSVNRRNQHRMCAHSLPARRCPLCPALFHLRSMVNTHLKKVHLNKHNKRRNRIVKHTDVFWRTETVPIQDLSVSIQNEVMEIQSSQDQQWDALTTKQAKRKFIPKTPLPALQTTHVYTVDNHIITDLPQPCPVIMSRSQEFKMIGANDYIKLPSDL